MKKTAKILIPLAFALIVVFITGCPTPMPQAPAAPTDMVAVVQSQTEITAAWTDNSDNEDGFTLQYATAADFSGATDVSLGVDATESLVTGLTASTEYYFRVKATNTDGNSAWSNTANATTETEEVTQYMGPLFFATGSHGSNYYFENVTGGWQHWPVLSAQAHYDAVSFNMGTFDRVMIVGAYGDGWIYDDKIVPNDLGASWKASGQSVGAYHGVAYGNGTLVAVGYDNETYGHGKIVYSDDQGLTWYEAYLDTTNGTQLWDVKYGNGIFVAVGTKVLYSSDGENWAEGPFTPLAHLRGIAFGNGWFVAVGSVYTPLTGGGASAVTYASQDGFTWFIGSSGTTNILNDVAYDPIQNRFIAVGWYGTILYTTNLGSSWTAVSSGTSSNLNAIAFGNGMLMVGGSNSVAGGDIDTCYSTDHGTTWTVIHNSPLIYGICWKP